MIHSLATPHSVPDGFQEVLEGLTQQGYRVLALGYRTLDLTWREAERLERCGLIYYVTNHFSISVHPLLREAVECDLQFCGLLVLENKLKPQTTPVIRELQQANIRTVMITGIHVYT